MSIKMAEFIFFTEYGPFVFLSPSKSTHQSMQTTRRKKKLPPDKTDGLFNDSKFLVLRKKVAFVPPTARDVSRMCVGIHRQELVHVHRIEAGSQSAIIAAHTSLLTTDPPPPPSVKSLSSPKRL